MFSLFRSRLQTIKLTPKSLKRQVHAISALTILNMKIEVGGISQVTGTENQC